MTKFLINGGQTYSGKGSITLNITPNPKNDRTSVNEGVLKISYGNNKTKEVSLKQLASGTSSKKIFRLRFINYTETEITWNCSLKVKMPMGIQQEKVLLWASQLNVIV